MIKVSQEIFFEMDKMKLLVHRTRKGIDGNYTITSRTKSGKCKGYYVVDKVYRDWQKRSQKQNPQNLNKGGNTNLYQKK